VVPDPVEAPPSSLVLAVVLLLLLLLRFPLSMQVLLPPSCYLLERLVVGVVGAV
jgi:hypothetical protein